MSKDLAAIIDGSVALQRIMRRVMGGIGGAEGSLNLLQIHTLSLLKEHDGWTMKDLASSLSISASSATAFVERLVQRRCIARVTDPKNRRVVRLRVTPEGRRLLVAAFKKKRKLLQDVFSHIPTRDRPAFARILSDLCETLRRSPTL